MNNRIVITTYGSLGNLYPYMAISVELKFRENNIANFDVVCRVNVVNGY